MPGIGKYKKGKKFELRSGNTTPFLMMGSSDKDELVEYTYPAHSTEARGGGYKSGESRDVLISKGTQRLINAGAPKEVIEKSKLRDMELFKQAGGKSREL